jgi:hypothetical protein
MVQLTLETALWLIPLILESAIVIVMLVQGRFRQLPYFFCYLIYDIVISLALKGVEKNPDVYFYSYWYSELISWVLVLAVVYEIYSSLLKEYAALQKLGAILFWVMGIVLALIALWTAFHVPGSESFRFYKTVLTMERSMRIVQSGLLIVLFIFASFFALSWKNYLFGIALGFAVFVSVELAIVAVRAYGGKGEHLLFRWLKPASYNLAALVWSVYLLRRSRAADLRFLPKTELAAWNEALQELLHK